MSAVWVAVSSTSQKPLTGWFKRVSRGVVTIVRSLTSLMPLSERFNHTSYHAWFVTL